MTGISRGENKFQSKSSVAILGSLCGKSEHWVSGDAPRALALCSIINKAVPPPHEGQRGPVEQKSHYMLTCDQRCMSRQGWILSSLCFRCKKTEQCGQPSSLYLLLWRMNGEIRIVNRLLIRADTICRWESDFGCVEEDNKGLSLSIHLSSRPVILGILISHPEVDFRGGLQLLQKENVSVVRGWETLLCGWRDKYLECSLELYWFRKVAERQERGLLTSQLVKFTVPSMVSLLPSRPTVQVDSCWLP